MIHNKLLDVIIVGGSYAGLSAAMALGRSLRSVLIIDSGNPCNKQTPHSHNFITQDGNTPKQISALAKEQVLKYDTVAFFNETALAGKKIDKGFEIQTGGEKYSARKLLFATGIADQLPSVNGLSSCWGISVLHCPYCHGYEVKGEKIGIMGNGDLGFELCRLIYNWSKDLILFTNGPSTVTAEQAGVIRSKNIQVIETGIQSFEHHEGYLKEVRLANGASHNVKAVFTRVPFIQHCVIPETLECELTPQGFIKVDEFYRTTVKGVHAAGDNTSMLRAVSTAVAAGTMAGAAINRELIEEQF